MSVAYLNRVPHRWFEIEPVDAWADIWRAVRRGDPCDLPEMTAEGPLRLVERAMRDFRERTGFPVSTWQTENWWDAA